MAGASIGVHVAFSGHIGDLMGVVQRCADAGTPVPFVVVCSDPGLAEGIKRLSPKTVVVYRWVASGNDPSPYDEDGNGDGRAWVDELQRRNSQAPSADFFQVENEVSFSGNNQSQTYARNVAQVQLAMLRRADEIGIKLAVGGYMPGVFDPDKYGDALSVVFDQVARYDHAVLMHWYSDPNADGSMLNGAEYMVHRLLKYWGRWPKMPVLIGERGKFHAPRWRGVEAMIQEWNDCAGVYRPYRAEGRTILDAGWTIRGGWDDKWRGDDWTDYLPLYEAKLKAGQLR